MKRPGSARFTGKLFDARAGLRRMQLFSAGSGFLFIVFSVFLVPFGRDLEGL
jgi:hypothetical protein